MITCKQCDREVANARPGQQFCSRSCATIYQNTHSTRPRPAITCAHCPATIKSPDAGQQFCSLACTGAARTARAKRPTIACKQCTGDIEDPESDQQFCTRSCAASYNNAQRVGSGPGRQSHCNRGHEMSGDNVYVAKGGKRHCKECRRTRDASKPRKTPYVPVAQRRAEKVRKAAAKRLEPPAPTPLWRPAGFAPEPQVFGSRSA